MKRDSRFSIPPAPEELSTTELRQTLWQAAMDSAEFPMLLDSNTRLWLDRAADEYERRIEQNKASLIMPWGFENSRVYDTPVMKKTHLN